MDKEFYTAGELAGLFNISKQTMMYYDKTGLLKPAKIAANGYRYYSTPQYLTLEIILFLRRLDVSIPDIRKFLLHRSLPEVLQLLHQKEKECCRIMTEKQQLLSSLETYESRLQAARTLLLDQILLENLPAQPIFLTEIPTGTRGGLTAIRTRAAHVQDAFAGAQFKSRTTGWIIGRDDFFQGHHRASAVVTLTSAGSAIQSNATRSGGLYLSLSVKGGFFRNSSRIYPAFQRFMARNELTPDGDVYVIPVIDHWITSHPEEYIHTISLKVVSTPPRK